MLVICWLGLRRDKELTTLRVPTRTECGAWLAATISWMKFEVIPMMATREIACMARTTVKVMPRAPKFCPVMMKVEVEVEVGGGVLKYDWKVDRWLMKRLECS